MRIKKVLLTGVKWDKVGMIGSNLSLYLKKQRVQVEEFEGDIRKRKNWNKYIDQDFDMIIHLAARPGVTQSFEDPEEYEDINVNGTKEALLFAEFTDTRILYASSSNAYEWWLNPYASTKKTCEHIAEGYTCDSIGMRFHTVWPGRDDMFFMKMKNKQVKYLNVDHKRDFIHIDDLCSGIFTIMQNFDIVHKDHKVVDIGTGKAVKTIDVYNKYKTSDDEVEIRRNYQSIGERVHTKANVKYLKKLGWKPTKDILE